MKKEAVFTVIAVLLFSVMLNGCIKENIKSREEQPKSEMHKNTEGKSTEEKNTEDKGTADKNKKEKDTQEKSVEEESTKQTDQVQVHLSDKDNITPYQFLNLITGNAESISVTYTVSKNDADELENAAFYRKGDKTAVTFTGQNMKEKKVAVREVEKEGRVYYVMDFKKQIVSYNGPAEDILLYQMQEAAKTEPVKKYEKDSYTIYEYSLPFVQDEEIKITYRFYMSDGMLKKLERMFKDGLESTFEFSEFNQGDIDDKLFELPDGYEVIDYDYKTSESSIPPWWE